MDVCVVLQSNKESTKFQVYFVFCMYMSISARVCPAYLGFDSVHMYVPCRFVDNILYA